MKKFILTTILFLACLLCYGESHKLGKITVKEWAGTKNKKPPFCAYGMVDVKGNYEKYYQAYKNNTKALEDDHFDEKVEKLKGKKSVTYQLIFRHWLIGELFRIQEVHKKMDNAKWWIISENLVFKGKKNASLWFIKKELLKKTKSGWVGSKFKHLVVNIAFVEMSNNQTRIYYRMEIDAKEKRTLKATKNEVYKGINNILKLFKK